MSALERVHRYPRRTDLLVELLSASAVVVAMATFGLNVLRIYWDVRGVDTSLFAQVPWLRDIVVFTVGHIPTCCGSVYEAGGKLIPSMLGLALALLAALLVRYGLPTVRTSARGLLVEFAGGWLPVPWENIRAVKVTEVEDRYVILVETQGKVLTGWHRLYSLVYRLGFHSGFLVTSSISDFNELVRTLLTESDRVARILEGRGAQLQQEASSPLFRLLLSPAAFFSQKAPATAAAKPSGAPPSSSSREQAVTGVYPTQITALLRGSAILVLALVALRALVLLLQGIGLAIPSVRGAPPFSWLTILQVEPGWWPFAAALLALLIGLPLGLAILLLLPDVAARREGLGVRYFRAWRIVPWSQLKAIKVTELSETSQIVIVQVHRGLPFPARLTSLFYDGSAAPGLLVTSAMSAFEPFLKRIILEVMGGPASEKSPAAPIFQSHARSDLLLAMFSPTHAIDLMVNDARAESETRAISAGQMLRAARPMVALALLPPVVLLCDLMVQQSILPEPRTLVVALTLFVLGMLEWPIVVLSSIALDETSGGGEEGARAWYLYPVAQLPRLVAMVAVLIAVLTAVPFLPALLWIIMLAWVFMLAAGLWGELYDWQGSLLLAGGLIPVLFQLLVLIAYLVLR
jgi:hypothetical protein